MCAPTDKHLVLDKVSVDFKEIENDILVDEGYRLFNESLPHAQNYLFTLRTFDGKTVVNAILMKEYHPRTNSHSSIVIYQESGARNPRTTRVLTPSEAAEILSA